MSSVGQIERLLYSYAHFIDLGDFEGAAQLFERAKIRVRGLDEPVDSTVLLQRW